MGHPLKTAGRIACIGWGSLIADPRDLPCEGGWLRDGPLLPVEFARESGGKKDQQGTKITLVICPGSPAVRTYWTMLKVQDISAARTKLGVREFDAAGRDWIAANIGYVDVGANVSSGLEVDVVRDWVMAKGLAGAVWTSLPPGFKVSRGTVPSCDEVIGWLRGLDPEKLPDAKHYICTAPPQTDTIYRRRITVELGWDMS